MNAKALAGIILYSTEPQRLAEFYQRVIGIPFALQAHGKIREHYECLFHYIHFAILKRKEGAVNSSVVPSFRVDDLKKFITHHQLDPLHPIIDLGEGKCVTSVRDVDGNTIRLIQLDENSGG